VKKLCLPEHFSGMNVRCPTPVESQATSSARLHRIGTDGLVNECSCKSVLKKSWAGTKSRSRIRKKSIFKGILI